MKKISLVIIVLFCLILNYKSANSQVMPEYALYNQNLLLINPADAGINGGIVANMGHKIQWLGFKEAPLNTYVSFDALMTSAMGLGVIVNKQRLGLLDISNVNLNYSYRVSIANQHSIAFGVNINFLQNKISTQNLSAYELADAALVSNKFDESLLTNGAGISYRFKNLAVDFSSPLLFSYQENKMLQIFYSYLAYDFYLKNNTWRLQPSTFVKYSKTSPVQADINLLATWNSNIWGQATFATNKDITLAAGIFIKYIGIGYAYELNLKPMSYVSSGSHEIVVQISSPFSLSKKKPLYIDSRNRNMWK